MSTCRLYRYLYLAYFSQPQSDRPLYRLLRKLRCRSIVEVGIGDGKRTRQLLQVARRYADGQVVRYTGIDLFEASPAGPQLTIKEAYRCLQGPGVKVQLAPGDAFSALARLANSLTATDLLLIRHDQLPEAVDRAWFYVPRMLHQQSVVWRERAAGEPSPAKRWQPVERAQIERWAEEQRGKRRAA